MLVLSFWVYTKTTMISIFIGTKEARHCFISESTFLFLVCPKTTVILPNFLFYPRWNDLSHTNIHSPFRPQVSKSFFNFKDRQIPHINWKDRASLFPFSQEEELQDPLPPPKGTWCHGRNRSWSYITQKNIERKCQSWRCHHYFLFWFSHHFQQQYN